MGKDDIRSFVFFPESPSTISVCRDGTIFKNNPFFSNEENALQIILYNDEFVRTNPLGNKTGKYKVSAFYFTIGNLPCKKRSMLNSIYLLLMFPSTFIEQYGYETLLDPMIRDLLKLESDGIIVKVGGNDMQIFGTVSMLVADNLAQHSLGGYLESFSQMQRLCRYCMCTRDNIRNHLNDDNTIKRTVSMHEEHLACIEENPLLISTYGIKSRSELNKLMFFNTVSATI